MLDETIAKNSENECDAPGFDVAAALLMLAEQSRSIAEIAAALKCTVIELAMWRDRLEANEQLAAVERLHFGHARLLLVRLADSLIGQTAAIACGQAEANETQRKACIDLLKFVMPIARPRDTPRNSTPAPAPGSPTIPPRDDPRDPAPGPGAGPHLSEEAILSALQTLGEHSRAQTQAEHIAYNDRLNTFPELATTLSFGSDPGAGSFQSSIGEQSHIIDLNVSGASRQKVSTINTGLHSPRSPP